MEITKNIKIKLDTWRSLKKIALERDMSLQDVVDSVLKAFLLGKKLNEMNKEKK